MRWKFTILDRYSVATVIDEPVGWDANVAEITRDEDTHGIFFNNQGFQFEYYGKSMRLLRTEYDLYGWQGEMTLIIEEDCGKGYIEFARGRLLFIKWEDYTDYVKVPIENTSDIMDLRNGIDQKVNLEDLKAFDLTTDMVKYDKLPFQLSLPSKGIFMQNKAEFKEPAIVDISLGSVPDIVAPPVGYIDNAAWFQIVPQIDNVEFQEFGLFATAATPEHQFIKSGVYPADGYVDPLLEAVTNGTFATPPDTRKIYFDWATPTPLLYNSNNENGFDSITDFSIDINYSFKIELKIANIVGLYKILVKRRQDGTFEYLNKERIISGTSKSGAGSTSGYDDTTIWKAGSINTVSFSASYSNYTLLRGEYLFVAVCGLAVYRSDQATDDLAAYSITSISGDAKMETLSHFPSTLSKVFAVNEAFSRISESITNGKIKVYSQLFGRTDSKPYSTPVDGCAGLEVITDGIRIRRQENKIIDKTSVFSISLKDMIEGLNPIHNFGMGVEPDPARPGFNRLRIESWEHFYTDEIILSCHGVNNLTSKTDSKDIYSSFKFGYSKWEAEEYNGLDELLTERTYRTLISEVKNELNQVSTFISSGYAWEVTRRKGNANTKDWRFDKDVFILCAKRGATSDFFVRFNQPDNFYIAMDDTNEDYVRNFFVIGDTITISSPLNSGSFKILTVFSIPGNLVIKVDAPLVDELSIATITSGAALNVETGNIINPVNIVDPATIYNFRISPVRNALRWVNKVFESYKHFNSDCKLVFTDGKGNYFAEGELDSLDCKPEAGSLMESQIIDLTTFLDSNNAKPIMIPEPVTFEYPMSSKDYNAIAKNPYGLIYFENECKSGMGYIKKISYKPEDGIATFNLKPKKT